MRRWIGLVLVSVLCGCAGQDADGLARIGGKVVGKLEEATCSARGKLADGWQAVRASLGETTLDSRVSTRLRWEKALAGAEVQVSNPSSGVVELKGTVATTEQRRRAVELADSTQGVEKVVDSLAVADDAAPK